MGHSRLMSAWCRCGFACLCIRFTNLFGIAWLDHATQMPDSWAVQLLPIIRVLLHLKTGGLHWDYYCSGIRALMRYQAPQAQKSSIPFVLQIPHWSNPEPQTSQNHHRLFTSRILEKVPRLVGSSGGGAATLGGGDAEVHLSMCLNSLEGAI